MNFQFRPLKCAVILVAGVLCASFFTTHAEDQSPLLKKNSPEGSVACACRAEGHPTPSYKVSSVLYDWKDMRRDRVVPVKIYYPKNLSSSAPVILFSHGLGGSRDGYAYLGQYWASCGYVVVHLQHAGSDSGILREGMFRAAMNAKALIDRVGDVRFALEQLVDLNDSGIFQGKIDLSKVGMAGHSFGAITTQALIGQGFSSAKFDALADPRIKAAVILSPTLIMSPGEDYAADFAKVKVPSIHFTGTKDEIPITAMKPEERRIPYDNIKLADKYLIIFKGGDHMVFSGRVVRGDRSHDETFRNLVCEGTATFWDAYLKKVSKSKEWLSNGAFEAEVKEWGTFEKVVIK